jgi:hypothetical protein
MFAQVAKPVAKARIAAATASKKEGTCCGEDEEKVGSVSPEKCLIAKANNVGGSTTILLWVVDSACTMSIVRGGSVMCSACDRTKCVFVTSREPSDHIATEVGGRLCVDFIEGMATQMLMEGSLADQ